MSQYRMLIVDDDPVTLKMLHTYFTELGYEVSTASNSMEARERFSLQLEVLIIVDLPDIGGRQLWDELHDHSVYTAKPLIPALFIDTPVPVRSMGELSLDMEDAIAKPYDIEEVRLRVQNLIRAKQQFDRHRSSDNDLKTKGDQS